MKTKIYKNREILRGKTFSSNLNGHFCRFEIVYVDRKGIKIKRLFKYSQIKYANSGSLEGMVRDFINDNAAGSGLPLSRKAYMSSTKLKSIPLEIDGIEFSVDQVTNSNITIGKFIEYDDFLENETDRFLNDMNRFVLNNIMDNPPIPRKRKVYGGYFTTPYLFGSGGNNMYFTELGGRRTVVSESELERNREKHKDLREKSRKNREKMKKLEEEISSNQKSKTWEMARHR